MTAPLMPRATAVWLVENTTLTFRQISVFCEIHELEIQAMADGDVSGNIRGLSPVDNGQVTWEEIHRCEKDKKANLQASELERNVKLRNLKAKKVLSPSQRQDKPNAVAWILRNYPTIKDSLICKLIGTTKNTINAIRDGSHKDASSIRPKNPVTIGLCSEADIEKALLASQPKPKAEKKAKPAKAKKVAKTKKATKKATKKTTKKTSTTKRTKKMTEKKTTAKKPAAKKAAPAKKTTAAKKPAVKKAAPAKKATTAKKPAVKKAAPAKKTTAAKKPAVKKAAPAKKTAAAKKPAAKKAAPAKKTTAAKKPAVKKAAPAKKATAKKPAKKK